MQRSGGSARPGFDSDPCHKWVELVVGSRLAPRGFLRVLRFFPLPPPQKPTSPNSNLIRIEDSNEKQLRLI